MIQFLAAPQDDWKKWMNRKMATWRNEFFRTIGWSSNSNHTKPPPSQNGCPFKNFSSNHPCCYKFKYSTSPKQQRWPLPSLLYESFFYGRSTVCYICLTADLVLYLVDPLQVELHGHLVPVPVVLDTPQFFYNKPYR